MTNQSPPITRNLNIRVVATRANARHQHTPCTKEENNMTRFQEFMNSRQFSQYRLHKISGFTKTQISEWQHGKHLPSMQSVRRLALTLRIPVEDLVPQLDIRERKQNARTPEGKFVPKTRNSAEDFALIVGTNGECRTGSPYCQHCNQVLRKAA
jgi:transcriptional regulator with XRE-family HTH domain